MQRKKGLENVGDSRVREIRQQTLFFLWHVLTLYAHCFIPDVPPHEYGCSTATQIVNPQHSSAYVSICQHTSAYVKG
jgi:hypothetical protein